MRTAYNNSHDVIHLFAQQTQPHARSTNVFFYDNKIYSYGYHYLLAYFIENKKGQKSILIDDFNAPAFSLTNKKASEHLYKNMVEFSIENSWGKLMKMAGTMMVDGMRGKDF